MTYTMGPACELRVHLQSFDGIARSGRCMEVRLSLTYSCPLDGQKMAQQIWTNHRVDSGWL